MVLQVVKVFTEKDLKSRYSLEVLHLKQQNKITPLLTRWFFIPVRKLRGVTTTTLILILFEPYPLPEVLSLLTSLIIYSRTHLLRLRVVWSQDGGPEFKPVNGSRHPSQESKVSVYQSGGQIVFGFHDFSFIKSFTCSDIVEFHHKTKLSSLPRQITLSHYM